MFAGKAGAYPSEAPFTFQVLHSREGSLPHLQTLDKAGKTFQGKKSSLLRKSVKKGFITLGPGVVVDQRPDDFNRKKTSLHRADPHFDPFESQKKSFLKLSD